MLAMMRIIKMDGQVTDEPGNRMFAIWNTVTDSFVQVLDSWAWESADELQVDLDEQIGISARHSEERRQFAVDRRERLVGLARYAGY